MKTKLLPRLSMGIGMALVVGTLLISSVGIAADSASSNAVNTAEAEQAALNHIEKKAGKMPGWDGATVSQPVSYYAPDMSVCAYEFTVEDGDKNIGFIIVSARKDWMPILEYGDGSAPSNYLPDARQIAVDKAYISENDNSKSRIFYWGACTYSMQIGDKMRNDGVSINLSSGRVETLPKESPVLQMDSQEARDAWSKIPGIAAENPIVTTLRSWFGPSTALASTDSQRFGKQTTTSATSVTLSGVPTYYQSHFSWFHGDDHDPDADGYPDCVGNPDDLWEDWDGCCPISGAMVIGYWYSQGYTSLPNPAYQETEEIVIDHCHYKMSTSIDGFTSYYNVAAGMEDVTDDIYGYDFDIFEDTSMTWADVTNEIDDGYPFVLCMWDNPTFGDHAVCAYGYEDDGDDSIRVFTTTNTNQNYYITWGNWSLAAISNIHP